MKVVVASRNAGKTHQLVGWVMEKPGRSILCATAQEAHRLKKEYGLNAAQVFTPDGTDYMGRDGREVAIDNAEWLLRHFVGPLDTIELVSLTGDDD